MSSATAVSATVHVRNPSVASVAADGTSGAIEIRPRLGFNPTSPQHEAGIRIEPPPSLPCPRATIPEATAAAVPPDEPPAVRERSHGLRVGPNWRGSVVGSSPHSGVLVLRPRIAPAERSLL